MSHLWLSGKKRQKKVTSTYQNSNVPEKKYILILNMTEEL